MKEGGIASFFVKDLGLVLAPKMCPDQSQVFTEVNISQAFPWEENFNFPFLFYKWAASRCSKACFYKVSRKYSKNWLRKANIRSFLALKIESTLIYDTKP